MKKEYGIPLLAIVLCTVLLLGVTLGLNGIATDRANRQHLEMLQTLLPGSTEFTRELYAGEDASIVSVHKGETGFVVETTTYGYAGDITMLIGVTKAGNVTGLLVADAHETLGLGSKALTDTDFLAQFLNKSGEFSVKTSGADAFSGATGEASADAMEVDALTGATVTSKAVVRCVNSAIAYVTGVDVVSAATSWGG